VVCYLTWAFEKRRLKLGPSSYYEFGLKRERSNMGWYNEYANVQIGCKRSQRFIHDNV